MRLNLILFLTILLNSITISAQNTLNQGNQLLDNHEKTISFIENKGQVRDQNWQPRPDVLFSGNAGGLIYHLKADGLHYQINKVESWKEEDFLGKKVGKQLMPSQVSSYRVDVIWIGANKNAKIIKAQELAGYDNFYNVPKGVEPALFVKSYRSITYKNIYDGIDLHFYEGKHGGIEYDFIVQPGADYKQIQLEINGGELAVTPKNELVIKTPFGDIIEGSLRVFQNDKEITSNWVVSDNRIAFEIENYNPLLSMKIDPPVRLWGTYYGGTGPASTAEGKDKANSCTIDVNNNLLICGFTASNTMIATTGSYQTSSSGSDGSYDAFLVKFNSDGLREWGTYYGGTEHDYFFSVATDDDNNILTAGATNSWGSISTVNSHQETLGGSPTDGMIVKFDENGFRIWGTYFGGDDEDAIFSIISDSNNLYVAGYSESANNISSSGSHQNVTGGLRDAFIAKFDSLGNLYWSSFYGGTTWDEGRSCTLDSDGNVYLAGYSTSSNSISTLDGFQVNFGGGSDAFLVKFSSNGVRLWGSYLGGSGSDEAFECAFDKTSQSIYLIGKTSSTDSISSIGSYKENISGLDDAFLTKFNLDGSLVWSTYFGGPHYDNGLSCSVDYNGRVLIGGTTRSLEGIIVDSLTSYQFTNSGWNSFVAIFNSSGIPLWSSYYGGGSIDNINSVRFNDFGEFYFVGEASSSNLISTVGSHQESYQGNYDGFVAKFSSCNTSYSLNFIECNNNYVSPSGNYIWNVSGIYNDTIPNSMGCDSILTVNLTIDTNIYASYNSYINPSDSLNLIVVNTSTGNILNYLWDFGDGNTSTLQYPQHTYATVGNYQICLTVSDSNCSKTYCDSAIVSKSGGIISVSVIAPIITSAESISLSDDVLIYPNPTNDYVLLQLNQLNVKDYSITLMNVLGEVVSIQGIKSSITKIDLPKSSGIYFIKVDSVTENKIYKIIKK